MSSGERGQALVEIALAVPIVLIVMLGGADFARVLNIDLALQSAARSAAELGVLTDVDDLNAFDAAKAVRHELSGSGVVPEDVSVTLTTHGRDGAPCREDPPTVAEPCFNTAQLRYTFRTMLSWPGVPRSIVLDRSRTFRRL